MIRQGTFCNVSLDEINSQFGSISKSNNLNTVMNLDELVKNVISSEEGYQNHLIQTHSSSSSAVSSSSSSSSANVKKLDRTFSKKTIDEVWNEIVDQESGNIINSSVQRQLTLGETTLEDFLIRAGVISLGNQQSVTNDPLSTLAGFDPLVLVKQQPSDWIQFDTDQPSDQNPENFPMSIQARGMDPNSDYPAGSDTGFENRPDQVVDVLDDFEKQLGFPMGTGSSSNPHLGIDRKRRYSDEMMERSYQRRQRRMIKNRESAARSRARKQAYTKELEQNVLDLQRTNLWLKKRKEMGMLLDSSPISGSRRQLRRTSSIPF